MARVVLEVDRPIEPVGEDGGMPLLLGSFVDVAIEGVSLDGVFEIPRSAVHEGDRLHLAGADDRLIVREVQPVWRRPSTVVVRDGLEPGDRLVLTHLPAPVDGMALRIVGAEGSRAERLPAVEKP